MPRKYIWSPFCFVIAAALSYGTFLSAAGIAATAAELDAKQAEINSKKSIADQASLSYGIYITVRDSYFYGADGFYTRSTDWFNQAAMWLGKWEKIVASLEGRKLADSNEYRNANLEIRNQLERFWILQTDLNNIRLRAVEGLARMNEAPDISKIKLPQYEQHLAALSQRSQELRDTFHKGLMTFDGESGEALQQIQERMDYLVSLKGKILQTEFPDLKDLIAEIKAALAASKKLEDIQRKVVNDVALIQSQIASNKGTMKIFDRMMAVKAAANEAVESIRTYDGVPVVLKQQHISAIEGRVSALESKVKETFIRITPRSRFLNFYAENQRKMALMCRSITQARKIDCKLFKAYGSYSLTQLRKMTNEQLAFIEEKLELAAKGPLQ